MTGRVADINDGQRPFWLQHEAEPLRIYALGVELATGTLVMWRDPYTGYSRFRAFLSPGEALTWLQRELGPATPLSLVWDERPVEHDVPFVEEGLDLLKPRASWRPAQRSEVSVNGRCLGLWAETH